LVFLNKREENGPEIIIKDILEEKNLKQEI
jgi:hypothetical protein